MALLSVRYVTMATDFRDTFTEYNTIQYDAFCNYEATMKTYRDSQKFICLKKVKRGNSEL